MGALSFNNLVFPNQFLSDQSFHEKMKRNMTLVQMGKHSPPVDIIYEAPKFMAADKERQKNWFGRAMATLEFTSTNLAEAISKMIKSA